MPPATTHTIHCPQCRQGLRVPGDRGRLRVRCAACQAEFEFQPPEQAQANAEPARPVPPPVPPQPQPRPAPTGAAAAQDDGSGWPMLVLGLGTPIALALASLLFDLEARGWLEFVVLVVLLLFVPAWIVGGLRRVARLGWPGAVTLGLAGYLGVLAASTGLLSLHPEAGLPPGHFSAVDPEATTVAELNDLMEDW